MITTQNLQIGYNSTLLGVDNFTLTSGVYILVGKNGSGKSTFLKTLTGQLSPVSGTVSIQNKDITTLTNASLPKTVAFVASHFPTVDFLKVSEYIGLGRSGHTAYFGTLQPKDHAAVKAAITHVGIVHLKDRFTNELSDGERQLVAIARAFAQETPVIALDEPTAFLDYANKQRILSTLSELASSHEKCIVLSSHDIDQSLEAKCPFLVVNQRENRLELVTQEIDKKDLLHRAFGG